MLRDHVLDWDDALPKDHVRRTERRARKATMSIAIGTSLRIKPVGDMPVRGGCGSASACLQSFARCFNIHAHHHHHHRARVRTHLVSPAYEFDGTQFCAI